MANPVNFNFKWAHSDNGYTPFTKLRDDIHKTDKTENGMKVLTIPMANISMNGYYKVECGAYAGFTNTVSVTVLVRPSAPAFIGLQDIDECKECIVGYDKGSIEVYCKTSGGTPPNNVTVTVGDKQINALQYNTSVYTARITLDNRYHNRTVTCSVMNSALISPLITTAKVYVIKPPAKVVLSTPSYLKEGSLVNITCQSQSSRPSPIVYLTISGINVSSADVNTIPSFNKETLLYNTATTLTTFKREWNGKDIICCSYNKWYRQPRYCSKPEQVNFLLRPSAPAFTDLQDIDECKECIVGSDKENIEVHCKTSGGTPPVDVKMTVGDKQINALQLKTSVYTARITLDNRYHNRTVTCAVMNSALISPLMTTAKVYVIKPPAKVVLSTPSYLKEGSLVNIIYQSQSSRPSPIVYLTISGINVLSADVNTIPSFNKETLLNNNATTLTTFKREWNGKDIICCSYNKWYRQPRYCSKPEQVNFLFPPSDIKLEINFDSLDPLRMYAVCTLNNSNPACTVNFTTADRIICSERNSSNIRLPNGAWKTKYFVRLDVNKEDDGKDVTCAAVCTHFQDLELRDTKTMKVPHGKEISVAAGAIVAIVIGSIIAGVLIGVVFTWVVLNRKRKVKGLKKQNQHQPKSVSRQTELNVSSPLPNTYEQLQTRTDTESRMTYDSLDTSANSSTVLDRQPQYESLEHNAEASHTYNRS
ncbi:synaptogenesis protein syg-2-like [Ruditapes philippinarum]|uniref:synaptogenesis protein syg-2-like n=1 Tax=Ruditapes philippinarum TaxID=129788 RepID=UPI00295B1F27|nr:synaptogenesis protein syg-2-like [Ruditapes philippinarum]